MDCTMVAAAPALPAGYVVSASRIADRRMILAGYRSADLLRRDCRKLEACAAEKFRGKFFHKAIQNIAFRYNLA